MNSKNIAIIVVVAAIIVAVAGFTWYITNQDDDDDGYRHIDVGDNFLYLTTVQDSTNEEASSMYYYSEYVFMSEGDDLTMITAISGEEFYEPSYYYSYIISLDVARTDTLEFMGEDVECNVYEYTVGDDMWIYWLDLRTGAFIKILSTSAGYTYSFDLIESSLYGGTIEVNVNQQDSEVEVGDIISYLVREYSNGDLVGTDMLTRAVTAVTEDEITYNILGTDESITDPKFYFLNTNGFRGLEPVGSAYVKNTEYGNIMCDAYLEENDDGSYTYTFVGKDDGVVYLRQEYNSTNLMEYSLAYSSLVIGSGVFDLVPVDEPFGYTVTSVMYTIENGVPVGAFESDQEVYIEYPDGSLVTTIYTNMEYEGDYIGTPGFVTGPSQGDPAEGKTINTPWGALECEAVTYINELNYRVTEYVYDGFVIAILIDQGTSSTYQVYTYYGYEWGRDDPFTESEMRTEINAGDWCTYIDRTYGYYESYVQVTHVYEDGTITVLENDEESSWTVEGLLKGPGYENGEFAYRISGDFLYGTRYCDVYISTAEDGTIYTSYIGMEDGILYALGVERSDVKSMYELYWASYIL